MIIEISIVEKKVIIYTDNVLMEQKSISTKVTNKEIKAKLENEIKKIFSEME